MIGRMWRVVSDIIISNPQHFIHWLAHTVFYKVDFSLHHIIDFFSHTHLVHIGFRRKFLHTSHFMHIVSMKFYYTVSWLQHFPNQPHTPPASLAFFELFLQSSYLYFLILWFKTYTTIFKSFLSLKIFKVKCFLLNKKQSTHKISIK